MDVTDAELEAVEALLGQALATAPPAGLREAVLARAASVRPAGVAAGVVPAAPLDAYRRQVDDLAGLLGGLDDGAFRRPAAPYEWDVHGLVAHLVAIEAYTAWLLGVPGSAAPADSNTVADHVAMSQPTVDAERGSAPRDTVARWVAAATRTIDHLAAGFGPAAGVVFHDLPMGTGSLLLVRAFELWTHADDIRRAVGLPERAPEPGDVHAMAALSVTSLPLFVDAGAGAFTARVVLTGEGGGAWTIAVGEAGDRAVTIVADAVDYCRCVARRIEVDEVAASVEGDASLARGLLEASRAVAV